MTGDDTKRGSLEVDEVFSSIARVKATAFLAGCDEAEFRVVAERAEIMPSALSKAATTLEAVGYLRIKKGHVGRRSRTWLALTPRGRDAFQGYLLALSQITEYARTTAGADSSADETGESSL